METAAEEKVETQEEETRTQVETEIRRRLRQRRKQQESGSNLRQDGAQINPMSINSNNEEQLQRLH